MVAPRQMHSFEVAVVVAVVVAVAAGAAENWAAAERGTAFVSLFFGVFWARFAVLAPTAA